MSCKTGATIAVVAYDRYTSDCFYVLVDAFRDPDVVLSVPAKSPRTDSTNGKMYKT